MLKKNMMKLEDYNRNIFSSKIDYVYVDVDAIDYMQIDCNSICLVLNYKYKLIIRKTAHNIKTFKQFGLIND